MQSRSSSRPKAPRPMHERNVENEDASTAVTEYTHFNRNERDSRVDRQPAIVYEDPPIPCRAGFEMQAAEVEAPSIVSFSSGEGRLYPFHSRLRSS